jgi:hypothetical protein
MFSLLHVFLFVLLSVFFKVVSALGTVALTLAVSMDPISIARLGMFSWNTFTALYSTVKYTSAVRKHLRLLTKMTDTFR